MLALLATLRVRRWRLCFGLLLVEESAAPARPSLPPPTFTAAAEAVEAPASGPGVARCLPSNVVPLRRREVA